MAHRIKTSGEVTGKSIATVKAAAEKPPTKRWRPGEMDDRGLSPDFERGAERDNQGNSRQH